MSFQDNMYPYFLQQSLNQLRLEGSSCDVVLLIGDKELKAHKNILSAASPYFSAMFDPVGTFKESKADKITLNSVDSDAVKAIVEFIYTSKIKLTKENAYPLMEASSLFQIFALRVWISNYLQSNITAENCLSLYVRATLHDYYDLAESALCYIKQNFSEVAEGDEFLELPVNVFMNLLSSKFLNVANEAVLIKYIFKWMQVDRKNRKGHVIDLFKKIEFTNIPAHTLIELQRELLLKTSMPKKVAKFLDDEIFKNLGSKFRPVPKWETVRYGLERGVILAIGGKSNEVASRSVECFTLGYQSWKNLIPQFVHSSEGPQNMVVLPAMRYARYNAAVAHDCYNVHVLGGKSNSDFLDECETFNIKTNTWTSFNSMPRKLEGASAVIFEGRLVVIGGRNESGCTNECWQWDKENKWKKFPSLNCPRSFHCSVTHGGYIFTLGGFEKDKLNALRTGERYDPCLNKWVEVPSMQKARAKFGCAVVNNCIYVLGGIDKKYGLKSVEQYNLETSEWSYVAPMLSPRHSFVVSVFDTKIYCIGGSDTLHYLHNVDKFNTSTNRWHFILSMQTSRYGLGSATLFVPYMTKLRLELVD